MGVKHKLKLTRFPGAPVTTELLLNQLLELTGSINSISVVVEWDDESMDTFQTKMKTSKACMAAMAMHRAALEQMYEDVGSPLQP